MMGRKVLRNDRQSKKINEYTPWDVPIWSGSPWLWNLPHQAHEAWWGKWFIEEDLPAQITDGLKELAVLDSAADIAAIDKQIADTKAASLSDAIKSAAVAELEAKKKSLAGSVDITAVEADVYNHLTNFFSRYYDDGDFISQRRYKDGVYAIPYEGEEVKLYWANADQYYVKTSEYFTDYTFKTMYGETIRFKLVDAQTERDNNKASEKRFFQLHTEKPFEVIGGELYIFCFFYTTPSPRDGTLSPIPSSSLKKKK